MLKFKLLAKSFVFFLLYAALGQQVAVANTLDGGIDFGFVVDPDDGVELNPISGNAPGLVDDLKSSVNESYAIEWNQGEDLEDYCAKNPGACEAPAMFSDSSNPLNFDKNNTLGPDGLKFEYDRLVDFHGYNTGFLIEADVVVVKTSLNFGGAKANDNDFGKNHPRS